jgi:hypothetical protein
MKYLRYITTTLVIALIFGGYFYYLTMNGQIEKNPISNSLVAAVRPYPALTNPKEVTLNCNYHGSNLTVSETMYGSLADYYRSDPGKKSAYLHNGEKDFVFNYAKDASTRDIASKISAVAATKGLNADQTLDLSACFLQSIPYDDAKAARILGPDFAKQPIEQVIPRYPYETLYDGTGICTDKTYLGAAVMSALGYNTSILTFDAQKHMSLGVAVPSGYGSFGTKYGIMELTGNGFLVGDVPELSSTAGLAINGFDKLPQVSTDTVPTQQLALTNPSNVIVVSTGSVYQRIIDRQATKQKLESLRPQLTTAQNSYKDAQTTLAATVNSLTAAEAAYKSSPNDATYRSYSAVYRQYQSDYAIAQAKINQYNNLVNLYNSAVEKYRQF